MREKLIELLGGDMCKDCYCEDCEYEHDEKSCIEHIKRKMADHLIANGVTFAKDNNVPTKWIPVTERLPDKDGTYLIRFANKSICDAEYENKFGSFGYWLAIMWDEDADWFPYVDVTHWMPMPEPPKGE